MTSRDFVYFLQGFFELSGTKEITAEQAEIIKRHLNMVFYHEIDPSMGDKEKQKDLNDLHGPPAMEKPKKQTVEHAWHDMPWDGKLRC